MYKNSDSDVREINVLDLWRVFVEQKKLIVSVVLVVLVLAGLYLVVAKPVYRAESYLLPPLEKDVQGVQRIQNKESITPKIVYAQFQMNLGSRTIRRQLFDTSYVQNYMVPSQLNKADIDERFETFNEALKVSSDSEGRTLVLFESHEGSFSARVVNDLIEIAHSETLRNLFSNIENRLLSEKRELRERIAGKRSLAKTNRLDRLEALKEALLIAEKLRVNDLTKLQSFSNTQGAKGKALPLYLFGSEALKAEIFVLQARKIDDPFIKDLRSLEENLSVLDHAIVDKKNVLAARVDQLATVPQHKIKPNKRLVLFLAGVIGFLLGVGVAFVRDVVQRNSKAV